MSLLADNATWAIEVFSVNGIEADSTAAKEHPLIKEFVNLVDATAADGVLNFTDLQTPSFMKFCKHFIIFRHKKKIDDFRVVLFGSHVVSDFGKDCTGKLMSEMGFAGAFDEIYNENVRVIKSRCRVYTSGSLFWQNREFKKYRLVRMPLQRKGSVNESLTCVVLG